MLDTVRRNGTVPLNAERGRGGEAGYAAETSL